MLDVRLLTWSLGLFAVVSFVVCVAYGLIAPQALHMHTVLETVLPGFRWLTVPGFFRSASAQAEDVREERPADEERQRQIAVAAYYRAEHRGFAPRLRDGRLDRGGSRDPAGHASAE